MESIAIESVTEEGATKEGATEVTSASQQQRPPTPYYCEVSEPEEDYFKNPRRVYATRKGNTLFKSQILDNSFMWYSPRYVNEDNKDGLASKDHASRIRFSDTPMEPHEPLEKVVGRLGKRKDLYWNTELNGKPLVHLTKKPILK